MRFLLWFVVLTVAVGLLLLGIVVFTATNAKLNSGQVTGYALVAGGGLSNWVDRARNDGSVVDFLNLGITSLSPPANLAPIIIGIWMVAGIALLIYFVAKEPARITDTGRVFVEESEPA